MDIKAIIKEHLPEGTELTDKTLSAIEKGINKVVGVEFVPNESYSKKTRELSELETETKELRSKIIEAETYKTQYEAEVAARKQERESYEAEKIAAEIDDKVAEILKKGDKKYGSLNAAAIPKALKQYDRSIVKRNKDGSITNVEPILEYFGKEWGEFFAKEERQGAHIGSPPGNPPEQPANLTQALFGAKT